MPKVRTGCVTCKVRHVKCDERRPLCSRCDNAHIKCDGYVRPAVKTAGVPVLAGHGRLLLPRGLTISSCLDRTELLWDKFESEFYSMVVQCRALMTEDEFPAYRARFTLGAGLITPLGSVLTKCRDHNVRMMAAELMKKLPWREGAWDADKMINGKLGGAMPEERGGNAEGFISSEHRWFWTGVEWDADRRRLQGTFVRATPDENGRTVVEELELDLNR